MSYRGKMTLMFAGVAATTAIILIAVLGVNWEAQFMSYTRSNMERYASVIADGLSESYDSVTGCPTRTLTGPSSPRPYRARSASR